MPILLTDLIARVPAEVETKVRRVRDQNRTVVQEALRSECCLVMRTPQEAEGKRLGAQVRVEVSPGYPAILNDVTFPDHFELISTDILLQRLPATTSVGARDLSGVHHVPKLEHHYSGHQN